METLLHDLRYAVRRLLRSPGFTVVAVGTLALGIGATAAIFTVVRGVLLEPLPYPEPDRIVQLWQVGDEGQEMPWSEPNFQDIRERNRSFGSLAAYRAAAFTVTGTGEAARVAGAVVSDGFFSVLDVQPAHGRAILPEEHRRVAPVVVISHGYWQSALAGDPDVLGRDLRLDGRSHRVVGVLPPGQAFPAEADLWIPRDVRADPSRTAHNWRAIGRVAEGVTLEGARQDLGVIAAELAEQHGDDTWMAGAAVIPLHEELVGRVRPALMILLGAAGVLLLIACANVANLLLARATVRRRELAVRLALGAGRGRLLRQLLTESFVLALAGGAVGLLLAVWGVGALLAVEPGRLPRLDMVGVEPTVLAFAFVISAASALGIGLGAALRATSAGVRDALAEGGRANSAGRVAGTFRGALVTAQVALTLLLLVGAGLLGRSFVRLITLDPGYRTQGAVTIQASLPAAEGESNDPLLMGSPNPRGAAVLDEMLTRLGALPGVSAVGGINSLPLTGGGSSGMFLTLERPDEVKSFEDWSRLSKLPGRSGYADYRVATGGYFEAMDIPLLRGRLFNERDGPGQPHVAVVNASLAEAQWPGEDPLGKLVQFGNMDGDFHPFTIVGVVGDTRDRSLEAEPQPIFYGNARQRTTMLGGRFNMVVARGDAAGIIPAARSIVQALSPEAPVRFRTLAEIFSGSLSERRFSLLLLAVFGVTALLLAAMGIYGVISYVVAQRTREIGIRMALGAQQASVLRLMVRQGLVLTLLGLGIGLAAAYAATRVLASQLYGVGTLDPVTFGAVAVLLTGAAFVASYIPARRATRVDPMVALRYE